MNSIGEAIARKIQNIRFVEYVTAVWFVVLVSWRWYLGAVFAKGMN